MHPFTERNFTVRDILRHEAEALSKYGPSRGEPKEPESNLETFTRLRNFGAGLCRVKQWPVDEEPYAWGCRNEALLLDEPIYSPASWEVSEEYSSRFHHLLLPIDYTNLFGFRNSDGGQRGQLLAVLNNIFKRLTTVALIFLIQLWRRDPEHSNHPDYHVAFEALHDLSVQQIQTSKHMSTQSHEVAVMLPQTSDLHSRHEGYKHIVLGSVQCTGFAEKIHPANERGCRTTDEVLSSILNDADHDTNNLFMRFGLRHDWQSVALNVALRIPLDQPMGVSTSIWGYLRFFLQIETNDGRSPILYITRNVATDTAWCDESRKDHSSNFELLCQIYYFILIALLQTQGPRILPPDLRNTEGLLKFFSPTVKKPEFNFLTRCCFLLRLAARGISGYFHAISFSLLATLWELALHYFGTSVLESVDQLRIQPIEWNLERISERDQIRGSKCLWLRFDSWDVRDVTEIGINRRACLVLKVFHTHEVFESELRAYLALQEAEVTFVPQLLGFNVPGTKGALLLTMVGLEVAKEPFDFHDRRHLDETIRHIHTAGIHHHNLRIDNIIRGADGRLIVIDFGYSSRADDCKAAESCPDEVFLKLWVR